MTNEMKYLMHLYACAATSVGAAPPSEPVDFAKLYDLADRMSLLSMLSYALKISADTGCPDNIKSKLYTVMLGTSLKNKMRSDAVLKLLGDVEQQGIRAVVVKGPDCARYYAKPECRISADTDLFIDEKDEEALLAYFENNGYTVHRRKKQEHHSECIGEQTGLIEVHTKMCSDFVRDAMLKKVESIEHGVDNSIKVSVDGTPIRVLNPTDSMMFMTLHLVKHVMFNRVSLKMAYDMALYYTRNADGVDTQKYVSWLCQAGYDTVVSALFSSMVLYCGFSSEEFAAVACYDEQKGKRFADCLEQYNSSEEEMPFDYMVMLKYCTAQGDLQKNGKAGAFLLNAKTVIAEKCRALFPKTEHLAKSYPYLQKRPYLYMVACTQRFFGRGTKHVLHGDPKNGKIFGYRENLDTLLSPHEQRQIHLLKDMGLL